MRLGEQSARHNTDADALALVMALVVIGTEAVRLVGLITAFDGAARELDRTGHVDPCRRRLAI